MARMNEYTEKAKPADNDTTLIVDSSTNKTKIVKYSGLWDWLIDKMANAVISRLETQNKTLFGALNELNSKSSITVINQDIEYTDKIKKVTEYFRYSVFGSVCIIDIAGITFGAYGYNMKIARNIPIPKTRTISLLASDSSMTNKASLATIVYTADNAICIHVPPDFIDTPLYGQMVYFI